jgi:hypothetical protein
MAGEEREVSGPVTKIGPVHHYLAVGLLIVGTIAAVALVYAFQARSAARDANELLPFAAFRAEYADHCNVPAFAGPAPEVVEREYLSSAPLRDAIAKQRAALKTGASCEQVATALKKVDYAVPAAGAP